MNSMEEKYVLNIHIKDVAVDFLVMILMIDEDRKKNIKIIKKLIFIVLLALKFALIAEE